MKPLLFKTECRERREARDLAIYNEYNELMTVDGQSKTLVNEFLRDKYHLHATGTIYSIRRRVEERLKKEEEGRV